MIHVRLVTHETTFAILTRYLMKVFLSWSKGTSRQVADALKSWLPMVLQSLEPWTANELLIGSPLDSGVRLAIETSDAAIICLTRDNVDSTWINFELGVMAGKIQSNLIFPLLIDFPLHEIRGPVFQFQAFRADYSGIQKLLGALNGATTDGAISEEVLDQTFELCWPELDGQLSSILKWSRPVSTTSETPSVKHSEKEMAHDESDSIEAVVKSIVVGSPQSNESKKQRVFIVHGHNQAARATTSMFLERVGLEPVVLDDMPSGGRTIIEKFTHYAHEVVYSVVLLTADDVGGTNNTDSVAGLADRSRQNVIFELGYFTAALGRSKVCVLHEKGVELPSDFHGVVYIPLDNAQGWQFKLARELRSAGLDIDLNNLL